MRLFSYSVLLYIAPFISHTLGARCPIIGPLLRPPQHLSDSSRIITAGETLTNLFDSALSGSINAGWQTNITSFSIILTDASSEAPLWEYHHTASGNVNNTGNVTGDTQFMIASVTKVFADLALLKIGVDLDDSITKYIPELGGNSSLIAWRDITLRSLGNHLAAIPQTYGFPDDYTTNPYLEALGFPPLRESDYPICSVNGLNTACTKELLIKGLAKSKPVYLPFSTPSYSSLSFTLLGYVIEEVTGKTFEEVVQEEILEPLGMKSSRFGGPINETSGVIPPVMNVWGADFQDNNPGSGLYSTSNDLNRFVRAIVSKTILDTPAQVREWLKPNSETASLYSLVGMPWEIARAANLTPAHPHIIDIYAKDGHVPGYTSRIGIISEYDIGFTVLTAGLLDAINPIVEALLSTFIPEVEEATRDEAQIYVGNFSTSTSSEVKSHLVLTIDDGPGLKVTEFVSNSSDMLDGLQIVRSMWPGNSGDPELDFRLYPAVVSPTVYFNKTSTSGPLVREDWRLMLEPLPVPSTSELPSQGVFDAICTTWQGQDAFYYGGESMDRFVFLREGDEIVGVELPFLRISLTKQ